LIEFQIQNILAYICTLAEWSRDMTNKNLPVANYRSQILVSVKVNSVTIIVAETGAGKSTQVPQYLLDEGYEVVVTQPRRLAARSVAERVAEEVDCPFGDKVGFRTALDRAESQETRCLFVTDGLQLVRELMVTTPSLSRRVLVLDEVHEWNLNLETLVAWARAEAARDAAFRLVIMSATMESEALARYFGDAPVITIPGRTFPVEHLQRSEKIIEDVKKLVSEGRNVLVFQPGKGEITALVNALKSEGIDAEILALHGELTSAEQKMCFMHYTRPKVVVSTNVAQTSVTIDDIDAVVDSGMERRVELVNGVEGLYLRSISLADSRQRAGRAGRTKPGVYIDHCRESGRREFPIAEIERVRLDQSVLKLAMAGIDMEELRFFHQPAISEIHAAKASLQKLGCMDIDGRVTDIGKQISKLPLSVKFGRMVLEAIKLGVVGDIITAAAILESGALNTRRDKDGNPTSVWRELVRGERESDIIAQMHLYDAAGQMMAHERFDRGIHPTAYNRVKTLRKQIENALERRGIKTTTSSKRDHILQAVCAGMVENLYQVRGSYLADDGETRLSSDDTVVHLKEWTVGIPFDLHTRRGVLKLVTMITSVTPSILEVVAPHLVDRRVGQNPSFCLEQNEVVSTTEIWFDNQKLRQETVLDPDHPQGDFIRIERMYSLFVKPDLISVDTTDECLVVPAVRDCIVGTHPNTGLVFKIFGTFRFGWYGVENVWVRDQVEANDLRDKFVVEVKVRQQKEQQRIVDEAQVQLEREEQERIKAVELEKSEKETRLQAVHEIELQASEERGEIVRNFSTFIHESGICGQGNGWVICSDGSFRAHDRDEYSKSYQRGIHTKVWDLVCEDELLLVWGKSSNASPHECVVQKLPKGGVCTDAQLRAVLELEKELESSYKGATGLTSGRRSPPIGNGFGFVEKQESKLGITKEVPSTEMLKALLERFSN
jgi:ATP-dependent helicase HrpB